MSGSSIDPVLDQSLDKLLVRELTRILALKTRLLNQLSAFEKTYSMTNADFYQRYEMGEMGDEMDLIEWAATIEMLTHLEKKLITDRFSSDFFRAFSMVFMCSDDFPDVSLFVF